MRRIAACLLLGVLVLIAPAPTGAQAPAPETVNVHGPDSPASDATPTFEFSSPDANTHFECRLNGGPWGLCTSPRVLGPLPDGAYTFEVRAVNASGIADPTPVRYDIVIDTAVPDTAVAGPDSTATAQPSFTLTSTKPDPVFACRLDSGLWDTCTTPYVTPPLPNGPHHLEVRASDHLNHTDGTPATVDWTIRVPKPVPTPTPTAEPTPTPVPEPSRNLARLPGSLVAERRCQLLDGGTRTASIDVPKVGRVRVHFRAPTGPGVPLGVTVGGLRLVDVQYGVDGLATTAATKPPYRLTLDPVELQDQAEHLLLVRLRRPGGRPHIVSLNFTTTPCDAILTQTPRELRVDSRSAMSEVAFVAAGIRLDGAFVVISAFGSPDRQIALGPLGGERAGVEVSRRGGEIVVRGLPAQTGIVRLDLARPLAGAGGARADVVVGGQLVRLPDV
ncbi:MAG: large repetitive protein [Solirubrobacteraceae bacterium]|jgi:hypothetical protein|nr:large repetitive protein [Solirubrobacteraceae bacterium]